MNTPTLTTDGIIARIPTYKHTAMMVAKPTCNKVLNRFITELENMEGFHLRCYLTRKDINDWLMVQHIYHLLYYIDNYMQIQGNSYRITNYDLSAFYTHVKFDIDDIFYKKKNVPKDSMDYSLLTFTGHFLKQIAKYTHDNYDVVDTGYTHTSLVGESLDNINCK